MPVSYTHLDVYKRQAFGGAVEATEALNRMGFTAVLPIQPFPVTLEEAMQPEFTKENIERTFQNNSLAALGDIFPCGNDFHTVLFQKIFISCAVVAVPGKAV